VQLEPAGSAKRGLKDGPADMNVLVIASWFSRLVPATVLWKQRFAVARATCGAKSKVRGEAKAEDDLFAHKNGG